MLPIYCEDQKSMNYIKLFKRYPKNSLFFFIKHSRIAPISLSLSLSLSFFFILFYIKHPRVMMLPIYCAIRLEIDECYYIKLFKRYPNNSFLFHQILENCTDTNQKSTTVIILNFLKDIQIILFFFTIRNNSRIAPYEYFNNRTNIDENENYSCNIVKDSIEKFFP